jgi:hypothetical protein
MTETSETQFEASWRRLVPPWWTVLFPLIVTLGVGGWRAATAESGQVAAFVAGLVWPGSVAFLAVAAMVWLGWVLDID